VWGASFSSPIKNGPGAHPASYIMGTGSFPGLKRPWPGVDYPITSSAEVKETVELYLYSPSEPTWSVLGRNLPFLLHVGNCVSNQEVMLRMHTRVNCPNDCRDHEGNLKCKISVKKLGSTLVRWKWRLQTNTHIQIHNYITQRTPS